MICAVHKTRCIKQLKARKLTFEVRYTAVRYKSVVTGFTLLRYKSLARWARFQITYSFVTLKLVENEDPVYTMSIQYLTQSISNYI